MNSRQSGMTLVIALVMLVVLTLLVVSAIRFGNINLKIAGNAQSEVEATAAVQLAVERTIIEMVAAPNINTIDAKPSVTVSTGGQTYTVSVAKPACQFTSSISNTELDPTKADDLPCFEGSDGERLITADNTLTATPTACKQQRWDVRASVDDTAGSGVKVTMLQGLSTRVGAEVSCP